MPLEQVKIEFESIKTLISEHSGEGAQLNWRDFSEKFGIKF